ncbi:hypothetical protein J6TS2_03600 [Heyndrickxia sporothermodurans]|nr:hypothetical protein J6TS2_03600 [Heyndrickxia sporothermodurans]
MANMIKTNFGNGLTIKKKKRQYPTKNTITLRPGGCMCGKQKKIQQNSTLN